jgi:hypothetical protein
MTFCYAQRGTLSVAAPFLMRELTINTETMRADGNIRPLQGESTVSFISSQYASAPPARINPHRANAAANEPVR